MNTSELSEWMVDWQFQNVKMPEHGRSGTISVTAKDEVDAHEKAKRAVSMSMFRTPVYEIYVVVTELTPLAVPEAVAAGNIINITEKIL